jgi:atypical dual specificity phosphatase
VLREFTFTWIEEGKLAACSAPASSAALETLAKHGISLIVNLHLGSYRDGALSKYGMRELHLPVTDLTAPTRDQINAAVAKIAEAINNDERVAVHCVAGLGRTGTVVACWLVAQGMDAESAIAHVRGLRPGSIETSEQEETVRTFALSRAG